MSSEITLRETLLSTPILPVLDLYIPLPYKEKSNVTKNAGADAFFKQEMTKEGRLLPLPGTFLNSVSYTLDSSNRKINLSPISITNPLTLKFQKLCIHLPQDVIDNCFVVSSFVEKELIFIDVILSEGIVCSFWFRFDDFLHTSTSKSRLTVENFKYWGRCFVPYDFNARSPHHTYAVAWNELAISLCDGGAIHLIKSVIENSNNGINSGFEFEFDVLNFGESGISFFKLGGFFSRDDNRGVVATKKGININCIVNFCVWERYLIGITIEKILKVWDLDTHSLLLENNLNSFLPSEYSKILLDINPMKYLDMVSINNEIYLSTLLSVGNGLFKIWKFDNKKVKFLETEYSFNPSLPDNNSIWLIQDYLIRFSNDSNFLNIWFLWKSNTSSIIQNVELSKTGETKIYKTESNEIISSSLFSINKGLTHDQTHSEYYIDKIFNQDNYSELIVETSLKLFDSFYNNSNIQEDQHGNSSSHNYNKRDQVLTSLNKALYNTTADYNNSISTQWKRFDSLCSEFKKLTNESISMSLDADTNFIVVSKASGYSIVRDCTDIEAFFINQTNLSSELPTIKNSLKSDIEAFLILIEMLKNKFSHKTLNSLGVALIDDFVEHNVGNITAERINSIYDNVLSGKIEIGAIDQFMINLGNCSNSMSSINYLIDLGNTLNLSIESHSLDEEVKVGGFGESILIGSLKQVLEIHYNVVFDLLLLTLVVETNQEIVSIYSKLIRILINYKLVNEMLKIGFNAKNELETEDLNKSTNSLFTKILFRYYGNSFSLNSSNFNSFYTKVWKLLNDDHFIYYVVAELLSLNYPEIVKNKFVQYLPKHPISDVLIGVTYYLNAESSKFFKQFNKDPLHITEYELSSKEVESLASVDSQFISLFKTNKVEYYRTLSSLSFEHQYYNVAMKFEIKAIEYNQISPVLKNDDLYLNLFNLSLVCCDFESAYNSLMNLSPIEIKNEDLILSSNTNEKPYNYNVLVTEFVEKLFETSDIKKLITFPFISHISIVDKILFKLAKEEPVLKKSLNYYKVLYSWRLTHGDSRGACESLYMFITRFDNEKLQIQRMVANTIQEVSIEDKLKNFEIKKINLVIAELYIIILNLLSTFNENDDKWILRYGIDKNQVLTFSLLQNEYFIWLRKLESELKSN